MRKKFMLLIIASIMIVTFVSCEGDIFQSISDFMGGTSTNVLIDGEIVSVPTGNIENLSETLGGTTTADVTDEQVDAVRDSVEQILASQGETEAAKELLEEPAGDVPDDVEQAMLDLEAELGLEPGDLEVETKGDLAAAILLADLKKKQDALPADPTPEEKETLVKEAKVVVEFVKKVSGVGEIDVTTALTELLEDLMNRSAMRRMVSRFEEGDGISQQDVIDYVKPLFNMYFKVIDTDKDGEATSTEVTNIAIQYAKLRKAYETMAIGLAREEGEVVTQEETKYSDLINYLSAVIISANNQLIPTEIQTNSEYPTTFATILNLVKGYADSGSTELPSGDEWFFIDYNDNTIADLWTNALFTYLETIPTGKTDQRYITIFNTVLELSRAIPDNDFITGELENILADLTNQIEGE